MAASEKIKVGIIGAGRIGRLHAEHLSFRIKNVKAMAIADIILSAAEEAANNFNIPTATQDYRHLLDDKSLDAVVICSATDTHAKLIEESAAAGKHIFCEKPIDFDLNRINQALAAVDQAGVKLQVGFNRRFDPNFLRVKEIVTAGKIGQPHILRITSRDPAPPPIEYVRVSGGIFLDMTIHDFDMARYLMNCEVEEVYATGNVLIDSKFKDANDIDTAIITLKFENGAIGTIDNSRQAVYGYDQRVEVFGSEGMVYVSNNKPDTHVLMNAESVQSSKPLYFFVERYEESYIAELQAFIDAIVNDTKTPVSGYDGLMPVKIGLAAKKSFKEKRPVKVSEL
jgi:myo-inositol 2-dehydrogenase/D-chiro-inositol 1-dehydrogenase